MYIPNKTVFSYNIITVVKNLKYGIQKKNNKQIIMYNEYICK